MNFESGIVQIIKILEPRDKKKFILIKVVTNQLIKAIDRCEKNDIKLKNIKNTIIELNKSIINEKNNINFDNYKKKYLGCLRSYKEICDK